MERPPLISEPLSSTSERERHHPASASRRRFIGKMGGAAAAAATIGLSPILDSSGTKAEAATGQFPGNAHSRVAKCFALRVEAAARDAQIPVPLHTTNGDEKRYPDKSGTYTKCLLQDGYGRVNLNAYNTMKAAFATGDPADFEKIVMGGKRTLNGPQSALAFDLEGCDSVQFGNSASPANQESAVVVPPPAVASAAYGTELVDLYWCSLLRDVAFTDYATNPTAIQAATEISSMPHYAGPRNGSGQVTPDLLFRGAFPGETTGPYISQFFITPTSFGQQPISQQLITYLPGIDYLTDLITWSNIQNGIVAPGSRTNPTRSRATPATDEVWPHIPIPMCFIRRTSRRSWC